MKRKTSQIASKQGRNASAVTEEIPLPASRTTMITVRPLRGTGKETAAGVTVRCMFSEGSRSGGALISRRTFVGGLAGISAASAPKGRIVFIAGVKTHGYGEHSHNAGCLMLAKLLNESVSGVETVVHRDGWPADPLFLEGANAIVVYMDGGDKHPILPHLDVVDALMKKGTGLAVMHYALVVPKGKPGEKLLDWTGGYYETYWSVNPFWTARFDRIPRHPVTSGVRPFTMRDEWYYHMRFRENMQGVTPVLSAVPPDETREGPDGPHSGNPAVRSRRGMAEHVAWVCERPGGGRGFGFTGAHYHWGLADDNYRRLLLNGIAWIAGVKIPREGIASRTPTWDELLDSAEGSKPPDFSRERAEQAIHPRE